MKFQWNKKYTSVALYVGAALLLAILCFFFFLKLDTVLGFFSKLLGICAPILYGILFAYFINPLMKLCEEKIFRGKKSAYLSFTARRVLAITISMIVSLLLIALFVRMIIPQLIESIKELVLKLPSYIDSLGDWANRLSASGGVIGGAVSTALESFNSIVDRSYELLAEYLPKITSALQSVALTVWEIVIGLVFAVYFLFFKERIAAQIKKILRAVLNERHYTSVYNASVLADKMFGRYFFGAVLDSVLVGLECFIMMWICGMPYCPLISVVIGVTNIIPFFGPFIGAIPSAVILFVSRPIYVIYFVIGILLIQQIDGNIIAPRIHGASTGLSPVWVIISITVMSGLFGVVGMFLGVPIFSVLYSMIKKHAEDRLQQKGLETDTTCYMSEEARAHAKEESEAPPREKLFSRIRRLLHRARLWLIQKWRARRAKKKGGASSEDSAEK